jgi:hypothetical protein
MTNSPDSLSDLLDSGFFNTVHPWRTSSICNRLYNLLRPEEGEVQGELQEERFTVKANHFKTEEIQVLASAGIATLNNSGTLLELTSQGESELFYDFGSEDIAFVKRFYKERLVLIINDDDPIEGITGYTPTFLNVYGILDAFQPDGYSKNPLWNYKTQKDLILGLLDTSDFAINCMSLEEYKKQKAERERQQFEQVAGAIARRHNVKPYSLAFLDAIQQEIDLSVSQKQGLYEDGLCAGDGTISGWYDLSDGFGENIFQLNKLQDWLEENVPLLWMQWSERQTNVD